ncbi:MAG: alcohol dehydrogenase catalytic domain-containing protein, partial [Actinomycetales bacterium]
MLAAYAHAINRDDPLSCLTVGEIDPPSVPQDWVSVQVRAASLNHHDLWALKGQALAAERLPMILGTDAAGITEVPADDGDSPLGDR